MEKEIGQKIRELRKTKGMSQMELAERIGLSFQQIQKYEKGINRISVPRLYQIAKALNVDICTFFEEDEEDKSTPIMEEEQGYMASPSLNKEEKELLSLFRNVNNKLVRKGIILLLRGIVGKHER